MPKSWDEWAAFVAVAGFALTVLGWLLNTYVKKPLDRLGEKVEKLDQRTDRRLDNHEVRLATVEEWKRNEEAREIHE